MARRRPADPADRSEDPDRDDADADLGPGRLIRRLLIGAASLLAVAGLSLGGGCWMWSRAHRRLVDDELARLEEAGLSVDWTAILGPEPDRNGATDIERVFEAVGDLWETDEDEATAVDGMALRLTDPEGHAEEFGPGGWSDPAVIDAKLPGVLARLASVETSLDAALAADGWRFEVAWGQEPFPMLPHLMHLKELGRLLSARSAVAVSEGRLDDAWADVVRQARVVQLYDGPSLLDWLVRRAMLRSLTEAIEGLLAHGLPTAEQASRIDASLAAIERGIDPGFSRAMRAELAAGLATFEVVMGERELEGEAEEVFLSEGLPASPPIFARLLLRDRSKYVTLLGSMIRATTPGTDVDEAERAIAAMETEVRSLGMTSPITSLLLPALGRCYEKRTTGIAELRLARAGIAVAMACGGEDLPERLRGVEVATDPFSRLGDPLRYHRVDARRATLWSVGLDRDDDRGRVPDPDAVDPEDGDVVFELRLSPVD